MVHPALLVTREYSEFSDAFKHRVVLAPIPIASAYSNFLGGFDNPLVADAKQFVIADSRELICGWAINRREAGSAENAKNLAQISTNLERDPDIYDTNSNFSERDILTHRCWGTGARPA